MTSKLIVQIVTWNSDKFLKTCLDSLLNQNYQDFSILVVDNGSQDKTIDILKNDYSEDKIKKNFKNKSIEFFVFQNSKNLGFSQAHNQGLKLMNSEYVLIMNPDIILEKDFLSNLMKKAEKEEGVGSFGGKLKQIKSGQEDYQEYIKTDIIDSTGFKVFKNRHFIDRGQGEKDLKQYDNKINIFGFSGACVLFLRQALEEIKIPKNKDDFEYFDEDFFAYQEDIDIAWRLRLKNWSCLYIPEAEAYHFRGTGLKEKPKLKEIFKGHQSRVNLIEFYSFQNHLWLLLKNSFWSNFFLDFFSIFFYQLSKEIYLLFFKPKVYFKASFSFWSCFRKMTKKRKIIMSQTNQKPKEIRIWFNKGRFYY